MERVPSELLEALRKALADPSEHRLYKSGKLAGLFAGKGGTAGIAAAQALRDGLLEITRTETRGKVSIDWARLTPRGVDYLYQWESPVQTLHALRETLAANRDTLPAWLAGMTATLNELEHRLTAEAEQWRLRFEGLERRIDETLRRLEITAATPPPDVARAFPWAGDALNYLDRRRAAGAAGPCPLPELYESLVRDGNDLPLTAYHDGLRRLQQQRVLRLQAIEEPAGLPRPEFALLDAGRVFYYVSL
jgi:hypothetical protein